MRRLSLALALSLLAAFALGLALARWWYRPDGRGPRSSVVLRFSPDGAVRVYGPTTGKKADMVAGVVGGRRVGCIPLP